MWDTTQYMARGYMTARDISAQAFCDVELLLGAMAERRNAHRAEVESFARASNMSDAEAREFIAREMAGLG